MKLAARSLSWQLDLAVVFQTIEAIAFWLAIALPFLHVPLILNGLETTGQVVTFLLLLLVNVLALFIGHGYKRSPS